MMDQKINKPIITIPHYIATDELVTLATNTIKSFRDTSDVFILSVDDGSPMGTKFLEDLSDMVIRLDKNSGFAIACNSGLDWAIRNGHYVGCANNDIEVQPGWLEAMLEPFDKWSDCGLTGLISTKDRHKLQPVNRITSGGLLDYWMQSGGLWMSTSDVLFNVGLFDTQFEVGGEEDVDLFLRIRQKYQIIMSGKSIFWHKEGATRWNDEVEPGFKDKNKAIEQSNYDRFATKWGWDIRTHGLNFYEEILEKNGVAVE